MKTIVGLLGGLLFLMATGCEYDEHHHHYRGGYYGGYYGEYPERYYGHERYYKYGYPYDRDHYWDHR